MSVCSAQDQVDAMRRVADANRVPMVDARARLMARFDDLKAHRLYPDEVRYYENLYGLAAMETKWQLYITTDGCHPNRAGMSVIADGLAEAIGGATTTIR
jgi:lysophospholipase L1-like esterase